MTDNERPVVLVVDDNENFTRAQERLLGGEYEVRMALSGKAGLEAYEADVDVVILDRKLPDIQGDEVAERMRIEDGTTQILMTTGVEPDVDIIELGIDDYLTKPVDDEEMQERIEEAIDRQTYDQPLQGYFSLANKRDVLAEDADIRETEQFSELTSLVDEMAREHIQLREEQFQTLVEHAPVAIVTLNENGRIDSWNPAARELFGWKADEVVGVEPPMFSGENEAQLEYTRTRLFRDTLVSDLDVTCQTKSGSSVDVSLSAAPLTSDTGIYGTLFVLLDITERKQRAQQITVMNRVLRHNIRNELNLLMGWLTELEREVTGENAEYARQSLQAAREIDDMAKKARDIQQTLADDREIREIDLVEATEAQLERAREEFPDATIETEFPAEAPIIAIQQIREAIWEVIENAIVHSEDGSSVHVRIDVIESREETRQQLTVADHGPGIPPHERKVLYEETEKKLEHGSGLGLWYLKWLLDRSDATLHFEESEFEAGTAVQMRFRVPGERG